ncbi:MAG: M67 family metallopeptidase [Candidatus Acidiferrales bacterium]
MTRVRREILEELLAQARADSTRECCGLVSGRQGVITRIYPAPNALASATEYEIAPADLFAIMRAMRADGLELMGIYHSHPAGENRPSASDIARAYYPHAAYFILSPLGDAPRPIRAFSIRDGRAEEWEFEAV